MAENVVSTPTRKRAITSYAARTQYKAEPVRTLSVKLKDAIDIHCHAHDGQQDAYALARRASMAEMKGLLFKSIVGPDPVAATRRLQDDVDRWAESEKIAPITCWPGFVCGRQREPLSAKAAEAAVAAGAVAVWLPVFTHANTLHTVGTYRRLVEGRDDVKGWTGPLSWDDALKYGRYLLGGDGKLNAEARAIVRMCADRNAALFFGHATHDEMYRLADEVVRVGLKRTVIDHPFSPFIDLSVEQMKELSTAGILFNFTYDELSPLLGVDPQLMYEAIRAVGVEHFTLSSDAGEPLFPDSVEAMRLVRAYMEAFGMNRDELYTLCTRNPAKVVGLDLT